MFHDLADDRHGNRQYQQGCQRHPHIDAQHHHQHTDQGGAGRDELCHALVDTHLQGIHIVGDPGKDLSVGPALKIFHGNSVDLLGNIFSQVISYII